MPDHDHPAIQAARAARSLPVGQRMRECGPSRLHRLANGEPGVYQAAMIEAGYLVRAESQCDGSGGFGPPPDSGLLGWRACPGCAACTAQERKDGAR